MEQLGITEKMLIEAIEKAGGAINRSGLYPLSEEIRKKLHSEGLRLDHLW